MSFWSGTHTPKSVAWSDRNNQHGELIEERIPYEMNLKYNNGTLVGTTVDEETKGLFDEPITVKEQKQAYFRMITLSKMSQVIGK